MPETNRERDLPEGQVEVTSSTRRPFVGSDRETQAYARWKPGLLEHSQGRFIVIVGEEMIGPFESRTESERAGYARFGLGPLFIKRVLAEEPITEVSRFMESPPASG